MIPHRYTQRFIVTFDGCDPTVTAPRYERMDTVYLWQTLEGTCFAQSKHYHPHVPTIISCAVFQYTEQHYDSLAVRVNQSYTWVGKGCWDTYFVHYDAPQKQRRCAFLYINSLNLQHRNTYFHTWLFFLQHELYRLALMRLDEISNK